MVRFLALGFTASDATMLDDAYEAVTKADMWEYLRLPTSPGKDGFMFSSAFELAAITAEMTYKGHSGASYAWTMRQMERIAKLGWDTYANDTRSSRALVQLRAEETAARARSGHGDVCLCRKEKGYTSGWCGNAGGGVPACDH